MDEIRIIADYHTHTVYSHGKGTVEDNVKKAIEIGLGAIAITDHGPDHFIFGVGKKAMIKQGKEIDELRLKYPQIKILKGVEANLKGLSGRIDLTKEQIDSLDIVLCGFHKPVWSDKLNDYFKLYYNSYSHFLYKPTKAQICRNTKAYVNMIQKYPIDIVTHVNYHLRINCEEVAKVCEDYGTVLELSSRHLDLEETDYNALVKSNCMLALNSDAHKVSNIANCKIALDKVIELGISPNRIVNCDANYRFRSKT